MTVRVTTLKGAAAGSYYVEALPNYYLDADEPRGVWVGAGAAALALSGEVADHAFLAVMAGLDPTSGVELGRPYEERSVRGFDVTASAPKSVSVLWALGDDRVRVEVAAAHDAAVSAMARWIEAHAHTRFRIGGQVAIVDSEGVIAARFRQHTSRALDPQLHTHLVIANRVRSPDGRWLALDARTIKHDQQALSAIYHASLRAEMTRRLGVRWRQPERGIAEMADMPDELLAEFSSRTKAMAERLEDKLDRFTATMDRSPTARERWRLQREAAVDSRPPKAQAVDARALHDGWVDQTEAIGFDPEEVTARVVNRVAPTVIDRQTAVDIATRAMAALAEKQSSWRPAELTRELAAQVPTYVGLPSAVLVPWLDELTEVVIGALCVDISRPVPDGVMVRKDGRPVTESVVDRALTTQAILDQEAALIEWVDRRRALPGVDDPAAIEHSTRTLNAAQAEAAAAVAGTASVMLVVGPAGTGKTTALAPAVSRMRVAGRVVFGVAPSAAAAEVLANETGIRADTLDKLLIEHDLDRSPGPEFDLPAGATVIVDEAGMVPTAKLADLAQLADLKRWRVALIGDPSQFSAVGRGGMFGLLVDTFGAIELDQVHRFTEPWERNASLRLRRGDVTVADDYEAHGRLRGGTVQQMERDAIDSWWEHRQRGETVALTSPTNETVDRLNRRCQQRRLDTGQLDPFGPVVDIGKHLLHVGDEIATRRNDRTLITDRLEMVRNRALWTITHVRTDGTVTVTGTSGTTDLPADYVAEHVDLAYARTGMGVQGRTVQASINVFDKPTDIRNLYVAMTRGRQTNDAFIVTTGEDTPADVFVRYLATDWMDQPALQRQAELNVAPQRVPWAHQVGPSLLP